MQRIIYYFRKTYLTPFTVKNWIEVKTEELYKIYLSHPDVTTDTRKCRPGALFFALKGERFDGNLFVGDALDAGCAYAVTDSDAAVCDDRIIKVENVLATLQELARYHRRSLNVPLLAITGTNGKTTTKELTAAVLSRKYNILATEGNLNNQIGVPLTLLKLRPEHQIAVIEMGASHPGDIKELVDIAEPDYGLITNVGKGHLLGFGSFEGVVRTKCELYDYIRQKKGKVFVRREDEILYGKSEGIERIEYGTSPGLGVNGRVAGATQFLTVSLTISGRRFDHVATSLVGDYNLNNILAAASVGTYFGVSAEETVAAVSEYKPTNSRSQYIKGERNEIILDAYNANPSSMKAAVENFAAIDAPRKMLIVGDMLELGEESRSEHDKAVALFESLGFDNVLLAGPEFSASARRYKAFADTAGLLEYLKDNPPEGYMILVKGSRGMKLESCLPLL